MDLRLNDHDVSLVNGVLSFVVGREAVAQSVTMAWRTWLGECVYDRAAGVPYLQVIFQSGVSQDAVRFILQQIARRRRGVTGILLDLDLNRTTRELRTTGTLRTTDGPINFAETLGGTP